MLQVGSKTRLESRALQAMRRRELEFFGRLLETRRREILTEAGRAVGSMNNKPEEAFADPTDRATLESDRNFLLRLRDRERKLLTKIDEAFARIEDGSYGRCEECAGEIGMERLKARPVTTLCIGCKSAQEEREQRKLAR
jgi:RNA polymerase-binding transcription factor